MNGDQLYDFECFRSRHNFSYVSQEQSKALFFRITKNLQQFLIFSQMTKTKRLLASIGRLLNKSSFWYLYTNNRNQFMILQLILNWKIIDNLFAILQSCNLLYLVQFRPTSSEEGRWTNYKEHVQINLIVSMAEQVPTVNPQQLSPGPYPQKPSQEPQSPQRQMDPYRIDHKCVCELCTCGKHHCPRPRVKGIFQTSYQDHYKQFKYDGNSNPLTRQYHYEMRHYNPDQLKSNYQETYIEKKLPPGVNEPYMPEMLPKRYGSFSDQTEYKKNFPEYSLEQGANSPGRFENIAKKMILSSPPVKFNASTSYNDHYKGYVVEKPSQQPQEFNTEFIRSPIKFEGLSNYKQNYVAPPKVESKPVAMEYQHVSVPFKGQSTYKNHFVGYRVEAPQPSSGVPMVNASPVKFEGKSAYQEHYDGKNIPRPEDMQRHSACICEMLNVPTVNYKDQPHLRFDAARGQWV